MIADLQFKGVRSSPSGADHGNRSMKPLAILKVGETFSSIAAQLGDFEHWIVEGIQPFALPIRLCDPRCGSPLPRASEIAGVIISGSHSMVTDQSPWSENLAGWLRDAVGSELPVLGICFGHQLLAHAFGGKVENHPDGLEIGSVHVELTDLAKNDALFSAMPTDFFANVIHRQSVRTLPENAVLLAGNAFERHQAFRLGSWAWGVQFHPEFSEAAMLGYLKEMMGQQTHDESIPIGAYGPVVATVESASILRRFADLVLHRASE